MLNLLTVKVERRFPETYNQVVSYNFNGLRRRFGLPVLIAAASRLKRTGKMNEITHYGVAGMKLVYTVRQPNGALRGLADRPLTETPPLSGYYTNNDTPELVVGDMVTLKDSESGNPVAAGKWTPEDAANQQTQLLPATTPKKKKVKPLRQEAIQAYQIRNSIEFQGKTLTDIANAMNLMLNRDDIKPYQICRWIQQVEKRLKETGLPIEKINVKPREIPTDPDKIEIGKRKDNLAPRQQPKKTTEDDGF